MTAHHRRVDGEYTVGDVARMAGVSVRTLHHYDRIGLLVPHGRSAGNHRLYSAADVERLRRILFYRALDFGLDAIADMLADPGATVDDHLRRQRRLLEQRRDHLIGLLAALDRELEARRTGVSLTPEEQLEIFGTDRFAERFAATEPDWPNHDQWERAAHRAAGHTREDWETIKAEAAADIRAFVEAIAAGEPADGPVAMDAAEQHRRHLERWFGPCSPQQHCEIAALYVSGDAATAEWEELAPGLPRFVHNAIVANARRVRGS